MGVKFLKDQCQRDLFNRIVKAAKDIQTIYADEIRSHLQTPEGMRRLTEGEITIAANYIIATILGDGWVLIDAYGSGSKMLTDHPGYDEYRNSKYWNPDRHDTAIRTWNKENAAIVGTNILGKKIKGSNVGGVNLEGKKVGGEIVEPQSPSRAIETANRWMKMGTIQKMLLEAVNSFPFHKYIVVTIER